MICLNSERNFATGNLPSMARVAKIRSPTKNHLEKAIERGGKTPFIPRAISMLEAKKAGQITTKAQAILSFIMSEKIGMAWHAPPKWVMAVYIGYFRQRENVSVKIFFMP